MLVHSPHKEGYGLITQAKNGPALGGKGAVSMANALKKAVTDLAAELWRSLRGRRKELSSHARLTTESRVKVLFAAPRSTSQHGTNVNTNDLLCQYFPKGTALSHWNAQEIQAVPLNISPRKNSVEEHPLSL